MTPTKYQLKVLKFYARCYDSTPLSQGVRVFALQWVILLLATGACFAFFLWGG